MGIRPNTVVERTKILNRKMTNHLLHLDTEKDVITVSQDIFRILPQVTLHDDMQLWFSRCVPLGQNF
jgi:hypothetical protein